MDYSKLTVEDVSLLYTKGYRVVINDGQIVNVIKDEKR